MMNGDTQDVMGNTSGDHVGLAMVDLLDVRTYLPYVWCLGYLGTYLGTVPKGS